MTLNYKIINFYETRQHVGLYPFGIWLLHWKNSWKKGSKCWHNMISYSPISYLEEIKSLCSKESPQICQVASIFQVVFLFSNIVGSTVTNTSKNFKRTWYFLKRAIHLHAPFNPHYPRTASKDYPRPFQWTVLQTSECLEQF